MLSDLDLIVISYLDIHSLFLARHTSRDWYEYVWKLSRKDLGSFLSQIPSENHREFHITWNDVIRCYGNLQLCVDQRYKKYLTMTWMFDEELLFVLEERPWLDGVKITANLDLYFHEDDDYQPECLSEIEIEYYESLIVTINNVEIFSYDQQS